MVGKLFISSGRQRLMHCVKTLAVLSLMAKTAGSAKSIATVLQPAISKEIPGLKIDAKLLKDEHISGIVDSLVLGKETIRETTSGLRGNVLIDEASLKLTVAGRNKWGMADGTYKINLKGCLKVMILSDNKLDVADKGCLGAATCESAGQNPNSGCDKLLEDSFKDIRQLTIARFIRDVGSASGDFARDEREFETFVFRKPSWIEFKYIPEAGGKEETLMSWTIAKVQHVFMKHKRDGELVNHHGIKLVTSVNGNDGKPIELLAHFINFEGERLTRYDPKVYKEVATVKEIKPVQEVLPKGTVLPLNVGTLLACVTGENLSVKTDKCVLYIQRILRYVTGDVKDCKTLVNDVEYEPFKPKTLQDIELTEDGKTVALGGNLGADMVYQYRKAATS